MQKAKVFVIALACLLLFQAALLPVSAGYDFDDPYICLPDGHVVNVSAIADSQRDNSPMTLDLWVPKGARVGCRVPDSQPFTKLRIVTHVSKDDDDNSFVQASFSINQFKPLFPNEKVGLAFSVDGSKVGEVYRSGGTVSASVRFDGDDHTSHLNGDSYGTSFIDLK